MGPLLAIQSLPLGRVRAATDPQQPARRACLGALPDELKLKILTHTGPNPFTLARMQRVDRDWARLAQDPSLWEPLFPRALAAARPIHPGSSTPQARLAQHLRGTNALRHLFFRELWSGHVQPATLVAAGHDAVFACHACLVLGPSFADKRAIGVMRYHARRAALYAASVGA